MRVSPRDPARLASELDEEIATHISLCVDELVRHGVPLDDATRQARARFGDFGQAIHRLRRSAQQREKMMRRRNLRDAFAHTVSSAARELRRSPRFSALVVATLALGIGANAVMYAVVDRLLLSAPPHVRDADALGRVQLINAGADGKDAPQQVTNYAFYTDLGAVRGFSSIGAYGFPGQVSLGRGAQATPIYINSASATFFPTLGVTPELGRFFSADEDQPPRGLPAAVISHEFWISHFGGDRAALGQRLPIGDDAFTIVGVAPPGFTGVDLRRVDVWLPMAYQSFRTMSPEYESDRGSAWLMIIARRRAGVSVEAASAEASAIVQHAIKAAGVRSFVKGAGLSSVIAARGPGDHQQATVAAWLLGVALSVWLIACANVGTLVLTRALRRRQEIAVRLALGISRRRLAGQLLAEGALFVVASGVAALFVAALARGVIAATLLQGVSQSLVLSPSGIVVLVAILSATVLAIAAAPIVFAMRTDVGLAIRSSGRTATDRGVTGRTLLLAGQAALSVALLAGAGLFVRSLLNAEHLRIGMDADRVLLAQVALASVSYDAPRQQAYWTEARRRVSALPAVESAALTIATPFGSSMSGTFIVPGRDSLPQARTGGPYRNGITADYFSTLGARVLRGRAFTPADGATAPRVMVINESMAQAIWPSENPVGRCVRIARADSIPCATIVGVVENIRRNEIEEPETFQYYLPIDQWIGKHSTAMLVRTRGRATRAVAGVRASLQTVSADTPYPMVRAMADLVDPQLQSWRMGARMFSLFGLLAFVVAMIGLYGLLAYVIAQRRREFGIRSALGAAPRDILALVAGQGLRIAVAGLAGGFVLALVAGRWLTPLLFHVSARDPLVFSIVGVLVLGIGFVASLVPARRAAGDDPSTALRAD
jgi:putative ABC transport system permease protein